MSSVKRVARNTSFLTISQVISYGTGFVYAILVARYLGPEGLGILNFAIALTAIFSILANFGLTILTTREVSRDVSRASKYAANAISIQLLLSFVAVSLIVVLVNSLEYSQETIYVVYILSIGVIVTTLSSLFLAIFQAFEQLEFQSVVYILVSVVSLGGAVVAILLTQNVLVFAFISLLANTIGLAYVYAVCVHRFFVPHLEADLAFWKTALKEAWPLAGMAISVMIYFRIDVIMISLIHDTAAIGFYSIAYKLSEASTVFPSMFIASLFPLLSRLHQDSRQSFRNTCAQSIRYLLYLALPMAFFVTLWAGPVVSLLYGAEFDPSVTALQILIWSAAVMYITMVLGIAFIAANLQRLSLKITATSVAVNIALNVLLIPRYSFLGASFATVVTEMFALVIALFFFKRFGYTLGIKKASVPPLVGLAIVGVVSALLLLESVPLALITVVDLIIYAAVIYQFGLNEEDKQLMLSLLRRQRLSES